MSSSEPDVPDRESPEYESYLAQKIEEEETRLKYLKDKCRVTSMEEELARLRIQSAKYETPARHISHESPARQETGIAADVLAASLGAGSGNSAARSPGAPLQEPLTPVRSRDEKDVLSKLKALSKLPEQKPAEKITYREFIAAMTKVLKVMSELGIDTQNYIAHMSFIASKAALNLYATDAIIKYEEAVTERVLSGQYKDWSTADPECVALHLGADATYAVRQGGSPSALIGISPTGQRIYAGSITTRPAIFRDARRPIFAANANAQAMLCVIAKVRIISQLRVCPTRNTRSLRKRLTKFDGFKMAMTVPKHPSAQVIIHSLRTETLMF